MRCLRSDTDEVESMWAEMVVFRTDLMNNWTDRHGFDRCEVDGIIILGHETSEEGWLRYSSPDTLTEGDRQF